MRKNIFQQFYHKKLHSIHESFKKTKDGYYKKIIPDETVGGVKDLQAYLENLRNSIKSKSLILLTYHNHLWEPVLSIASYFGLRKEVKIQNWLEEEDIKNILQLSGFEITEKPKSYLLSLITSVIARPNQKFKPPSRKYSVTIVVPARNEAGNIPKIVPAIPKFGKWQEIIFVEGNSTDNTWIKIKNQIKGQKKNIALKQSGVGKSDAVKLGFDNAKGDILMIYDADMTVAASDLKKFYTALAQNPRTFANGSRMVYPMEEDAMRTLNKIGNKIFSLLFSWILNTKFKDTLCGTKAIFKKDYLKYKDDYINYLKVDPFGDFALIFTAIKNKLRVVEIPIRYKERVYGTTNIKRFKHGLILLKMSLTAFLEFKL
ncbi:MAG TPA: glycosyltransferase family 2 protein [Patescibacteria group bacterium]|nr:glycosyltransferase family 2 protein [Patescibacteria group bacterium]